MPGDTRAWVRPARRRLAPIFASAQGTRLPIGGFMAGPSVAGIDVHVRGCSVVSYLPTVEKQQATGAGFGVIPVRTWSPPV
jgi:hypothetical protein